MEGVPFFVEEDPDDDIEESKDKKSDKPKKRSFFEQPKEEDDRKPFELFKDKKEEEKSAEKQEPPLEKLDDTEKAIVAEEVVKGRTEAVQNELENATPDSPDEHEALSSATFLEALHAELENDIPVEEAIDAAEEKTLEIIGLDATEEGPDIEAEESDEEDDPTAATTIVSTTPPTATPTVTTHRLTTPPTPPPVPPIPPIPPTPPLPGPPFHPGPGPSPTPPGPNFNAMPTQTVESGRDRHSHLPYVLLGGVIGYMIGRRGGRLRTEAKLLPVQEKLEKQVYDLQGTILEREQKIRRLSREQAIANPTKSVQIIERLEALQELKQEKNKRELHPENLGKLVVNAERPKAVELMNTSELLAAAATIRIEGRSAKQFYEQGLLNERGLRSIVKAYLRGEHYEKVLHENLVSPEIRHETQENHPLEDTATQAIKQAMQNPESSSQFALPSLNSVMSPQKNDLPFSLAKKKQQKAVQTKIITMSAVAAIAALAAIFLITR